MGHLEDILLDLAIDHETGNRACKKDVQCEFVQWSLGKIGDREILELVDDRVHENTA